MLVLAVVEGLRAPDLGAAPSSLSAAGPAGRHPARHRAAAAGLLRAEGRAGLGHRPPARLHRPAHGGHRLRAAGRAGQPARGHVAAHHAHGEPGRLDHGGRRRGPGHADQLARDPAAVGEPRGVHRPQRAPQRHHRAQPEPAAAEASSPDRRRRQLRATRPTTSSPPWSRRRARSPRCWTTPRPHALITTFADFGINYRLFFWTNQYHLRGTINGHVCRHIWYKFKRRGIEIPFPMSDKLLNDFMAVVHHQRDLPPEDAERRRDRARPAGQRPAREAGGRRRRRSRCSARTTCAPVAPLVRRELWTRGETVMRQGDDGETFYVIASGRLDGVVDLGPGQPSTPFQVGPGAVVGEMSLLTGAPRGATLTTAESCELLAFDREAFVALLGLRPEVPGAARRAGRRRGRRRTSPRRTRRGRRRRARTRTAARKGSCGGCWDSWGAERRLLGRRRRFVVDVVVVLAGDEAAHDAVGERRRRTPRDARPSATRTSNSVEARGRRRSAPGCRRPASNVPSAREELEAVVAPVGDEDPAEAVDGDALGSSKAPSARARSADPARRDRTPARCRARSRRRPADCTSARGTAPACPRSGSSSAGIGRGVREVGHRVEADHPVALADRGRRPASCPRCRAPDRRARGRTARPRRSSGRGSRRTSRPVTGS